MDRKEVVITVVLLVLLLAYGGFLIWSNFFHFERCKDRECFDEHLLRCERVKFLSEGEMVFEYSIISKRKESCKVGVKFITGDLSNQDSLRLKDKSMVCTLSLGDVVDPEDDISLCHGELKEGLQDIIISRLYEYLVQNLGKINLDILGN